MARQAHGPLRRALDARRPLGGIVGILALSHFVVAAGIGLLELYVDVPTADLLRMLAVGQALALFDNAISGWRIRQLLAPARPWLAGDRGEEAAIAAWRSLARIPLDYVRTSRGLPIAANIFPVSAYIALELGGPFLSTFLLVSAGATIVFAYGLFLRFFGLELVLRPLVADASGDVPDGSDLGSTTLPLKARLLIALPTMNVVTGVVVAGLAEGGEGIETLGVGVLLALAVAFTVSLELTLLLLATVLEPLGVVRRSTDAVAAGDLDARVPVLGSDEVGRLAGSFNAMVRGLRERERLREAFGAFVDPLLADRVLAEGVTLEGEDVEVSVLFVDVRDFTAFAERATARDVVAELNALFEVAVPVLVRHGGHANKFVGDGLLGVFGAPDALEDHADRALAAACEIVRAAAEALGGRLRIGIGVNSGRVIAGTVGGGGRVEFTVIGDVVNTAARVEHATRLTGDAVLLTDATRRLLRREHGPLAERPTLPLRGKSDPVRLFAALAAGSVAHRPPMRAV